MQYGCHNEYLSREGNGMQKGVALVVRISKHVLGHVARRGNGVHIVHHMVSPNMPTSR